MRDVKELDVTIRVNPSIQEKTNILFCCSCCGDRCPMLMCCINCFLLILFFWIICPIYCCIGFCVGNSIFNACTIKTKTYEKLEDIGKRTKLNTINLHLQDLDLNLTKIGCLRELILASGAKHFTLKNDI